jgi:hypothetical protein
MRFEFPLLFLMIAIGLLTKRLTRRGWAAVCLIVFTWIMINWKFVH